MAVSRLPRAKPMVMRLKALGAANPDVVGLDGEVSNSTYANEFAKAYPDRFFEQYIAEQQLVAAAVGMSVRHKIPFASTFAAFFSRAYDFIRMAAISRANIRLVGSHAGVSIGEDGPSQMALRRPGNDARCLWQYGGLSQRSQPDGAVGGADGQSRWHCLYAYYP